ncbi:MAG: ACP S-malonyltransferase [Desulfatibacillaceae bacterium]
MTRKIACIFPGQGSQAVGMGKDLFDEFVFVREIFDMADEIARANIRRLCFSGPMEELTETVNLQPAVTAVNLACLEALRREGVAPAITAGHSLGEYSALCQARCLDMEACLRLVHRRGVLMDREAKRYKGAMWAVVGMDMDDVREVVKKAASTGVVAVANHNTERQIVVTGSPEATQKAADIAREKGARAVPLKVSGAWHSELIAGARDEFADYLQGFDFAPPGIPVVLNVTGEPSTDPVHIKAAMARQLTSPVLWYDAMLAMRDAGVEVYAEVGPKNVLAGMLKKTLPRDSDTAVYTVGDLRGLEKFLAEVK